MIPIKPLGFLNNGEVGIIKEVIGGAGIRQKLNALGLVKGKVVRMMQNDSWGPVIVALGEARLALGRGMVQKILVDVR